jgi:hypothetical protein
VLIIAVGDALTLSGPSLLGGNVLGLGALDLVGGDTEIAAGTRLWVADWSVSGSSTVLTLLESVTYAGAFEASAGATVRLHGEDLMLTGAAAFDDVTVVSAIGPGRLDTWGTTTVEDLTIGGGVVWSNTALVTETGDVTCSAGTRLVNAATGIYDLATDSDIAGSSTSQFLNSGLFEKSGGDGVSAIAADFANFGTILAGAGTLEFQGALSGPGDDVILAAATLELDRAVAAGQTITFVGAGGELVLHDLNSGGLFHGAIADFGAGDTLDAGALFGAATSFIFTENSGGTGGVLALDDGSHRVSIRFSGVYATENFAAHSDGQGGTLLSYVS